MWKMYVLRSDIHSVKYAKIRVSADLYFPINDSALVRENKNMILFIYRKTQIGESQHFGIFYEWLGRNNSFKLYWLHDFKSYLFSRTDCDRATCKQNYGKKVIKTTSLSFCRHWVIAKAKTYRCPEKRLLIKFLQNLKRKTW